MGKVESFKMSTGINVVEIKSLGYKEITDEFEGKKFKRYARVGGVVYIPEKLYLEFKEELDAIKEVVEYAGEAGKEVTMGVEINTYGFNELVREDYFIGTVKGTDFTIHEVVGDVVKGNVRVISRLISQILRRGQRNAMLGDSILSKDISVFPEEIEINTEEVIEFQEYLV